MALQDDIMALLSQVGDAGDRATSRGRRGEELYGQIADRLSGDNRSKALREIAMLSYDPEMSIEEQMRFDPLTGSRVADIIEKYMDEVSEPLPDTAAAMPMPRPDIPSPDTAAAMPRPRPNIPASAVVPDDMIVDDTRAAEQMIASMGDTAGRPKEAAEQPSIGEQLVEMGERIGAGAQEYYDKTGRGLFNKAKQNIRARMGLDPMQGPDLNGRDRLRYAEEQGLNAEITRAAAEAARANNMAADEMISTRNFEDVLRAAQGLPERPARRAQTQQARQQEQFINNILMRFNAGEISERQARQMLQRVSPAALAELEKSGGMMAPVPRPYAAPTPPPARMAGGMSVRDKILKTYGGM